MSEADDAIETMGRAIREIAALRAENEALHAALELEHEETKRLREIILSLRALNDTPQ